MTSDDVRDAYRAYVTCSDPEACEGWIECDGDHTGYDPYDPDSPAYDRLEDVLIHGEMHAWRHDIAGWSVDYPGCPVLPHADEQDFDGIDWSRPGTYLLQEEWEEDGCWLLVVRRLSDDPCP